MLLLYHGESFDPNFFYCSGVDIDHSFFVEGPKRRMLLVPALNESLARSVFKGQVAVYKDPLKTLSKYLKGKTVQADLMSLRAGMAAKLRTVCRLKDHSEALLEEREVKRKDEVRAISKAVRLTKEIFSSLDFGSANTELDIKRQLLVMTAELGLEPAFEPIVSTGRNTAFPHYRAGRKRLGSFVLVDYGVRCDHYCSDLTRCFIMDGDRKKKLEYEKLQDVCHSIADAIPNLRTGKEVAAYSRKLIEQAGFPKPLHSIGHGIGLDVHELPSLGGKSRDVVAGATFALEPAFYKDSYGMRFEENIYYDGKKARIL